MTVWTFPDIWESVCAAIPDAPAIVQGARVMRYAEFDATADALARRLVDAGLSHQSKVAAYSYNSPEYLLTYFAAFKAGLVPFNVNYRYGRDEVAALLDNGDAEAVVFETTFAAIIGDIRDRLPAIKLWVAIPRDGHPVPDWAVDLDALAAQDRGERPFRAPWGRQGSDMMLLFTGGTTGVPKGVMWQQEDIIGRFGYGGNPLAGVPPLAQPSEAGARAASVAERGCSLIACPLMHGTGLISSLAVLGAGGTLVLLPPGSFDAAVLWDAAERNRANRIAIVGQAFAQPMLDALDAEPARWSLDALQSIGSSGTIWNRENKQALLRHLPHIALTDSFSSSEAFGMAQSTTTRDAEVSTASFALTPDCAVFTEDGRRVAPGSDETGRIAIGGFIPLGYYKDPVKSAETFPTIEGRRWSMPGDWARVAADGTILLLGRGSQCINTGGEKVFPEEVEEALKLFDGVADAAVTSVPDARFGERIVALVARRPAANPAEDAMRDHVRGRLAAYKAPRHFQLVDAIPRMANGKIDYARVKDIAMTSFA
ncbi:MAG: acyl-CoA synthetase [Sphingopyxis macrogoltabida]|uniref:Acyl-CoA synthetase n=1 Tax=Sphingopyxis macrogoltabida TaxID=33050 RepID=A0A2W5L1Z5_SPHMC|nr:MAG: acyl-CoA synthetase [Sphingopyxis macrogoltabida]